MKSFKQLLMPKKLATDEAPFWQHKDLAELNAAEWEALCDGCGKCCLAKIVSEGGGEILFTRVACHMLDTQRCRCQDYHSRLEKVPDCLQLNVDNIGSIEWLPATCAYRLRYEGKPLYQWHPLISGSPQSVHEAGMSVQGRVVSEEHVHPDGLEEHIVRWID